VNRAFAARHFSPRTCKAYTAWIRRFVRFHGRHPRDLGAEEVRASLDTLTRGRNVSSSTHVQALSAVTFFYRDVLLVEPPWIDGLVRPPRTQRMPLVLTREEVQRVLASMAGVTRLMADLLYGSGLRLECARLRVKDVDFSAGHLLVRDTKGQRDRITLLPLRVRVALREHLRTVEAQHRADLANGAGHVELPGALATKYPHASREWAWQWAFQATRMYFHPGTR
jgi:site-specific recombinase XerD